jgi:hypothetical protein
MDAYYEDGGAVVADPNNGAVIWTGGAYNNGTLRVMSVYRSTNQGTTWQRYSLTSNVGYTYAIAVAQGDPNLVYAGGYEGSAASIYKTTNNGGSWYSSSAGMTSDTLYDIAVHPVNHSIVFAATRYGIFKSANGAASWDNKGCSGVKAVLIDPADPTTVYAGTLFGVYKSMDTGETWSPMNDGLKDTCITSLGIYPGSYLFAGTREDGMYRSPLVPSGAEEVVTKPMVTVNVYPNPTAGRTEVNIILPETRPVKCSIYDAQGRLVKTLVGRTMPAGVHPLNWDGFDGNGCMVAAGVYLISIQTGTESCTRPLVIIR